jgi:hypothetical protein
MSLRAIPLQAEGVAISISNLETRFGLKVDRFKEKNYI